MAKSNNPNASKKVSGSFTPLPPGQHGTKDNSNDATLRKGRKPKSEAVRFAKPQAGKAVKQAAKQNRNDGVKGSVNVIPSTSKKD